MKKKFNIEISTIQSARVELSKYFPESPLVYSAGLSKKHQCHVYLKLENMQPIGSFKIRGAAYKISTLTSKQKKRGVIAASAGNHAQGVAWGSAVYGANALIVMPETAPLIKVENTKKLGAKIHLEGKNYDEAYLAAKSIANKTGRIFIHAYKDEAVIAGQGTIGLEILDQLPGVDFVIGSIGGGGLMAGVGVAIKELSPKTKLVGCQALGASSMIQSLKKGKALSTPTVRTFADGIAVAQASPEMLALLNETLDFYYTAEDESIAAAVLTLIEQVKTVSEGAGALPLCALPFLEKKIKGKKVVVIVGGGNIDVNVLSRILDRGLILAGRRIRVDVLIEDKPGSLKNLTTVLSELGVNILQAIHDREEPLTTMSHTQVALTLETRGPDHTKAVIAALKENTVSVKLIS